MLEKRLIKNIIPQLNAWIHPPHKKVCRDDRDDICYFRYSLM